MTTRRPPTFEGRPLAHPEDELVDQGLAFDLETHLGRRSMLRLLGTSAAGVVLAGCGASSLTGSDTTSAATAAGQDDAACAPIPEETAGPFPADGTNGPDVLTQSGVVRSDITSSFGGLSGTAQGVPLAIELRLEDAETCATLADAAVYLWHCDRDGGYSLYTIADQNYLRGVQAADAGGIVRFASIFPGCYPGRWPHVHFEVYPDLDTASGGGARLATSQIALPQDASEQAYATAGYEQSVTNLQQVSLATDMVFAEDGGARQLGSVSGAVDDGLAVALAVPVTT